MTFKHSLLLIQKPLVFFLWVIALSLIIFIAQNEREILQNQSKRHYALLAIPENIIVKELILNGIQNGLSESCGARIFKLSKSTLDQIKDHGLNFFSGSTTGRDKGKYYRYDQWIQTPISIQKASTLSGLSCIKIDENLSHTLSKSLEEKKSYLGIGYEYDLLVIPTLGLIVSTFNG